MKGIIALDIDGTTTVEHDSIPPTVVNYFNSLYADGWRFLFVTGRTFQWGFQSLRSLPFPYYFSVQNGALTLKMPDRKVISKKYLNISILPDIEEICANEPTDVVIYTGFENNDVCYYRPHKFDPKMLEYLEKRVSTLKETWVALDTFSQLEIKDFPSIKFFGDLRSCTEINSKLEEHLKLHAPMVRDPFTANYNPFNVDCYVVQANHPATSKGFALIELCRQLGWEGIKIAAGDDNNDMSMFEVADITIAMETAPEYMRKIADIVAPSAANCGIVKGLEDALRLTSYGSQ